MSKCPPSPTTHAEDHEPLCDAPGPCVLESCEVQRKEQPWHDIALFYPGQVSWPMLVDRNRHKGAEPIDEGVPVKVRHSEKQLALYGVEMEFKEEIKRQWFLTMLAGLGLIVAFGVATNLLMTRKES